MAAAKRITIVTVDDHPLLREGIAAVIHGEKDMHIVGEAANGREAIEVFRSQRPDVTLMDLQMPGMNGIEAIAAIRREYPQARMIVLTRANKMIASHLSISEATVKTHMQRILLKLGASDRTHAVSIATARGFLLT